MKELEKTVMSLTFSEYETALIEKAAGIAFKYHNEPCISDDWQRRKNYRRIMRLAVWAYARAIIEGKISENMPMIGTQWRRETKEEIAARVKCEMPSENKSAGLTMVEEMQETLNKVTPKIRAEIIEDMKKVIRQFEPGAPFLYANAPRIDFWN